MYETLQMYNNIMFFILCNEILQMYNNMYFILCNEDMQPSIISLICLIIILIRKVNNFPFFLSWCIYQNL